LGAETGKSKTRCLQEEQGETAAAAAEKLMKRKLGAGLAWISSSRRNSSSSSITNKLMKWK
jgi:hypothetical protein